MLAGATVLIGCSTADRDDDGETNGSVARAHEAAVHDVAAGLLPQLEDADGSDLGDPEGSFVGCENLGHQFRVRAYAYGFGSGPGRAAAETAELRVLLEGLDLEVDDGVDPYELTATSPDAPGLTVFVANPISSPAGGALVGARRVVIASECAVYSDADEEYAGLAG